MIPLKMVDEDESPKRPKFYQTNCQDFNGLFSENIGVTEIDETQKQAGAELCQALTCFVQLCWPII